MLRCVEIRGWAGSGFHKEFDVMRGQDQERRERRLRERNVDWVIFGGCGLAQLTGPVSDGFTVTAFSPARRYNYPVTMNITGYWGSAGDIITSSGECSFATIRTQTLTIQYLLHINLLKGMSVVNIFGLFISNTPHCWMRPWNSKHILDFRSKHVFHFNHLSLRAPI